ncbi:four-carbon acid sugar kinase family protein [Sphingobacterium paludis]|uniref:Uncharacterized protein YgbK (DUF1537 family) n=1 Tax=Sphingobacterium paludis TaxID=1476465 RepID=A0A4R7CSQ5_9SPHI|nr:four-carbon acid sugar kinase family protein [Sphingobacterium paludis]TDS10292.1 uncharacterized protein YgbK (DUF1537 family) [Sphingobacterium paludis]
MSQGSILVIADDLTGAAEIAGIALRHGLSSQIVQHLNQSVTADVLVLNSNSRSLKAEDARAHRAAIFAGPNTKTWDWVYLKFDSALRGHIKEELAYYQSLLQPEYVFFSPVNPNLDRLILGEQYLVQGRPIADTDFARDPEFPVRSSNLLDLLGKIEWSVVEKPLLWKREAKQVVAAAQSWDDVYSWAGHIPKNALCAGAAAFFEALLNKRSERKIVEPQESSLHKRPILYICGSNHEQSVTRISALSQENIIYWQRKGSEREVAEKLLTLLNEKKIAVFAVQPGLVAEAEVIRKSMADTVSILQGPNMPQELIIEGGATAQAVLAALQIEMLLPTVEHAPGVIRNEVPDKELAITLKPGSYPWTEELWAFGPQRKPNK